MNNRNEKEKWIVSVSVATIWTSSESPRDIDLPKLSNPVEIRKWLYTMSTEERLQLSERNLVQTQVLYGQEIIPIEEKDKWLKVLVPDQPSKKSEGGYPGWIPKNQVTKVENVQIGRQIAVVDRPTTFLYQDEVRKGIEISYLTSFPIIGEDKKWVEVITPHGNQLLQKEDITIYQSNHDIPQGTGNDIVNSGVTFLDLPYLWGGTSGYGFDCSGFSYMMHRANGINIPRDASEQLNYGERMNREELEPGDLLFFAYEQGKGRVHHVGIYYGDDHMLHAPNTGKSIEVIKLTNSKYEIEYCGARRYWEKRQNNELGTSLL